MLRQMSHWLQGVGVGPFFAVERLGQDSGGRSLAHPAGPGEQIGVADAIGRDGVREGLRDVLLADQFGERLRPIPPGDDDVLRAGLVAGRVGSALTVGEDIGFRVQGSGHEDCV